jgi:hypothetical protein
VWLLFLWVAGATVGMLAAGRFYAYYFLPLTAALAPLAGAALAELAQRFRQTPSPRWGDARHTLLLVAFFGVGVLTLRHEVGVFRALTSPTEANVILARMAREIRQDTTPDDCIFVWGTRQQVYALAERRSPSRFTYDAPFRHRDIAQAFFGEAVYAEMAEAIRAKRCPYVVVTDPHALAPFPELAQLLASDYELVEEATEAPLKVRLYRRRGQPSAEHRGRSDS